jgi:hypothetical protein
VNVLRLKVKKIMSFLFMDAYISLPFHFLKMFYKERYSSLGCELQFYKFFVLLSVYFYCT